MSNCHRLARNSIAARPPALIALCAVWCVGSITRGQAFDLGDLAKLESGRTRAVNALWIENPLTARFNNAKRVVVADIKGPATITMIHFALPQSEVGEPIQRLDRALSLRIFWDGEETPSVNVPLVDFFGDPAGLREEVNTALVNKRRGFNTYFPMPFRTSARIELVYEGPVEPGDALWRIMPCYSYVMYRTADRIPDDVGTFHASWRQEALRLGERDYLALDAKGHGKFVGWNATVRQPGSGGYPVDQNEKFFIDGEDTASIEFQGMEDSFGFSWGFPPSESQFPMTGFYPFLKGAAAYRFFTRDAISFDKSLRVMIGFGEHEDPMFRREFSKRGSELQFSTTCYWYQTEPHALLPALPPAADRDPAPDNRFWLEKETLPKAEDLKQRGVQLHMLCGRKAGEVVFAEPGFSAEAKQGDAWEGWSLPIYHCRSGSDSFEIVLGVPPRSQGTIRVFVIDPDHFMGGRKETVQIAGGEPIPVENFDEGRWIERQVSADETASGQVSLSAHNQRPGSNAVISIVEWVADRH